MFLKNRKENPIMTGFSFCIRSKFHKRHFLPIFALEGVSWRSLYIKPLRRSWIGITEKNKKEPRLRLRDYMYKQLYHWVLRK